MFGITFSKSVTTEAELKETAIKGISLNEKKISRCERDISRNTKEAELLARNNTDLKTKIKQLIEENVKLATHNATQEK